MAATLPVGAMTQVRITGEMVTGKVADIAAVIIAEETNSCQRMTTTVFIMLEFVNSHPVMHRHQNIVDS